MNVSVTQNAANVLKALVELQNAGLIENGKTLLLVREGYMDGDLEVDACTTVTRDGMKFVESMKGTTDD